MKSVTAKLSQLLLLVALVMPWTSIQAVDEFQQAGLIDKISYDSFHMDGRKYRVKNGASILIRETQAGKLSDLKPGDAIAFSGTILNDVFYVDSIVHHVIGDD